MNSGFPRLLSEKRDALGRKLFLIVLHSFTHKYFRLLCALIGLDGTCIMLFRRVGTENNSPSVACGASLSAPDVNALGYPFEDNVKKLESSNFFVDILIASHIIPSHYPLVPSQGPALMPAHRQAYTEVYLAPRDLLCEHLR